MFVDDKSSSDIGQTEEWCEQTLSLMMTMSMIIITNASTIQRPFKDSNNRDNALSISRGENKEKTKIPTAPSHLRNWFHC